MTDHSFIHQTQRDPWPAKLGVPTGKERATRCVPSAFAARAIARFHTTTRVGGPDHTSVEAHVVFAWSSQTVSEQRVGYSKSDQGDGETGG